MEKEICSICGKEYKNMGVHVKMAHEDKEKLSVNNVPVPVAQMPMEKSFSGTEGLTGMIKMLSDSLLKINERLDRIEERGKGNEFKKGIKEEDTESAKSSRENVDPRIINIVNEILGEDFGVEIEPNKDRPGFLFTIIVPPRLSDAPMKTRPIIGEDGKYIKDENGLNKEEEYFPIDRRSRLIASHQSFDSIREHAERVRSYVVSYFQKMSKPIPEFKLKSNVY